MRTPGDDDDFNPVGLVSAQAYAFILESPILRQKLLPQGLVMSPYVIERFDGVLDLQDPFGHLAVFERTQSVRFLQHGVSGLLDHFWGAGVTIAEYSTTAGAIGPMIRDGQRRHLVTTLQRAMSRGDVLTFATARTMRESFKKPSTAFELLIDHPIRQLSQWILFPLERPCLRAHLIMGTRATRLAVETLPGGRSVLRVDVPKPRPQMVYRIAWDW
jgi:hypothetical protein